MCVFLMNGDPIYEPFGVHGAKGLNNPRGREPHYVHDYYNGPARSGRLSADILNIRSKFDHCSIKKKKESV